MTSNWPKICTISCAVPSKTQIHQFRASATNLSTNLMKTSLLLREETEKLIIAAQDEFHHFTVYNEIP